MGLFFQLWDFFFIGSFTLSLCLSHQEAFDSLKLKCLMFYRNTHFLMACKITNLLTRSKCLYMYVTVKFGNQIPINSYYNLNFPVSNDCKVYSMHMILESTFYLSSNDHVACVCRFKIHIILFEKKERQSKVTLRCVI